MRTLALATLLAISFSCTANAELILTSVFHAEGTTAAGDAPQGVELFVSATGNYSGWRLEMQYDGSSIPFGTAGSFFTFGAGADFTIGDYIYVTSTAADVQAVTGASLANIFESGLLAVNGDDRVRLTDGTNVIDQYGVTDTDGLGEPWEYTNSFAYRNNSTDADGVFTIGDWNISLPGTLDSGNAPLAAALGTFIAAVPEPSTFALLGLAGLGLGMGRRRKK